MVLLVLDSLLVGCPLMPPLCCLPPCSYRVAPDARDPSDALLRKRQDKHYDPLVKWFEEVRASVLQTCFNCL
jgi:hypothetical protein